MEYYPQFPATILHLGARSIVLLTLSPLALAGSFDLHVLAMPPAFNLSHDQTLQLISVDPSRTPPFRERYGRAFVKGSDLTDVTAIKPLRTRWTAVYDPSCDGPP